MTADVDQTAALVAARQVADAVLYEGYVLFPYRASAAKNRYRWQWGVAVPAADAERIGEPDRLGCDVLVQGRGEIRVIARFLRLRHRQVHDPDGRPVDRLDIDGTPVVTWDEGEEIEIPAGPWRIDDLVGAPAAVELSYMPSHDVQPLAGGGTVVRSMPTLQVEVRVRVQPLRGDVTRVGLQVVNATAGGGDEDDRMRVLRRGLVGAHLLVVAEHGSRLCSLVDPPEWAQTHAAGCRRDGLHPVVVGPAGADGAVMLASPIILPDHPEIAPESPGQSFDATEVDELLALAVMGLTDEERAQARATDRRAAELVARTDTLPPEVFERLHGRLKDPALADRQPAEDVVGDDVAELLGVGDAPTQHLRIAGVEVRLGAQVRLHPRRRADAHDQFVDGRIATVERIVTTVEGVQMVGVTVDDDPAAELHRWYGRFQYFDVDEVAPLAAPQPASSSVSATGRTDHES